MMGRPPGPVGRARGHPDACFDLVLDLCIRVVLELSDWTVRRRTKRKQAYLRHILFDRQTAGLRCIRKMGSDRSSGWEYL